MQHAGLFLFSWLLYRFCSINTIVLLTIMSNSESLMKTSDFFYQKPIGVITYTWIYNNLMVRIIIIWFCNSLIHDFVILNPFSLFFSLYSFFVHSIFKLFFSCFAYFNHGYMLSRNPYHWKLYFYFFSLPFFPITGVSW